MLEVDGGEPSHPDDQVKSGEGLCLPPVKTNSSFRTSRTKENEETRDGHTRRASCGSVKLPAALVTSSNETNDRSSPATHTTNGLQEETKDLQSMPTSSDSIKLPAIPRNGSLVAIKCDEATAELRSSTSREIVLTKTKDKSSLSHDGALKPAEGGKNKKSVAHSSSAEQLPLTRQSPRETSKRTENPIKFQSQMKVTRQSTFKDTPLGYKPVTGSKQRGNSRDNTTISRNSNQLNTASASQPIREQLTRDSPTGAQDQNSGSMEQLTTEDPHRVASHSPHPLNLSRHLYQQAQRYDKLNHVLALLEQAKDSKNVEGEGSKPGTPPVKITELKTHIKTALDEAVRLRADTEALQHRVLNGVS